MLQKKRKKESLQSSTEFLDHLPAPKLNEGVVCAGGFDEAGAAPKENPDEEPDK